MAETDAARIEETGGARGRDRASRTDRPRHRWLLGEGVHRVADRLRAEWGALPQAAWRRWSWRLTWGLLLCGAAMWGATTLAKRWQGAGLHAWDEHWLRRILAGSPMQVSASVWAETPGNGVFLIPLMLAAAIVALWLHRPLVAGSFLASYFMLDLVVWVGWLAWNRARPDLVLGGALAPGLHAFPSGHLSQVVSAYGFLVFLWMRASRSWGERALAALLLLAVTAIVALARLVLGGTGRATSSPGRRRVLRGWR